MLTVSKSQLKANMLEIFRQIESSGEELIVTHHNKPVLRILPIQEGLSVMEIFGELQGQVIYHSDLDEPTVEEWEDV